MLLILGNLLFSGIGSITTSSRAVYSFSRDQAIPYYDKWTYVEPDSQSKVPKNSVVLSMIISYFLGLLALISTAAFNAFIGAAVLCLCSATFIPLVLVLFTRRRAIRSAPVKIRYKFGWFINIVSIVWLLLSMVSVCLPTQVPVTFKTMNYALMVYVFCILVITGLYFKWGKYNFRLPLADDIKAPIPSDAEETVFELEDSNVEHTLNSGTTVKESVENNSEEGFIKVHPKSSTENPFEENEENVITDYGDEHHTAEQEFDLADDRRYDI